MIFRKGGGGAVGVGGETNSPQRQTSRQRQTGRMTDGETRDKTSTGKGRRGLA